MPMSDEARAEVLRIFHHLPQADDRSPVVWWFAKRGDERAGSWAATPEELIGFAEAYEGWNFYVQPNPSARRYGMRCSEEDIEAWSWFLVDLDPESDVHDEALGAAVTKVRSLVGSYFGIRYPDPTVLHSGRGRQIWFKLPKFALYYSLPNRSPLMWQPPARVDLRQEGIDQMLSPMPALEARTAVRRAQRHWLNFLNRRLEIPGIAVDPSCADLPRVMRCPGTINLKTGKMAKIITLGEVFPTLGDKLLRYAPHELYLPTPIPNAGSIPPGSRWQAYVQYVTLKAANYLTLGAVEPGRHDACVAAARSLRDHGCSAEEARKALQVGAALCRPPLDDVAYIERLLKDTFQVSSNLTGA